MYQKFDQVAKRTSFSGRFQTLSGVESFCKKFSVHNSNYKNWQKLSLPGLKWRMYVNTMIFFEKIFWKIWKIKPRYICCYLYTKINKKTCQKFHMLFACKNCIIYWTAPWKFLIFIIQFSQEEADQVSGTLHYLQWWNLIRFYYLVPLTLDFFGWFLLRYICQETELIFITYVIIL